MTCIVAYDIDSDRIRGKLARYLEHLGVRLQESVFAIEIERHSFKRFLKQIEKIAGEKRKVAVFRLCAGCQKNALQIAEEQKYFHVF